jgi:hypothetical protein
MWWILIYSVLAAALMKVSTILLLVPCGPKHVVMLSVIL